MTDEVFGRQRQGLEASEYGTLVFVFQQLISRLATVALVQVKTVTNTGGVSPVGTVDVQPMVNQMTGDRQARPHAIIHNVPYFRLQGGSDAIILDPKVGDIGMCAFCMRDISAVKKAKGVANPGSYRTYDWADGLYLGGFLNGVPSQYFAFSADGIKVVSPTKITFQAPEIEIQGATTIAGTLAQTGGGDATFSGSIGAAGDVTADGTSVHTHVHPGVQSGPSNTGPPT